jgi:hypothetical protein
VRFYTGATSSSILILKNKIEKLEKKEKERLIQLVSSYRPSVKALLGAILEELVPEMSFELKKSLNPLSKYKIGISDIILENKKKWNIE